MLIVKYLAHCRRCAWLLMCVVSVWKGADVLDIVCLNGSVMTGTRLGDYGPAPQSDDSRPTQ
jgi:hypothetical protein